MPLRIILIGGTSHVGKSTIAGRLAAEIGWDYRSTDKLARHPGRPWTTDGTPVPQHVSEHYAKLSVAELMADVLNHYERNVLPLVEALVHDREADKSVRGLVLEGSALWPPFVTPLLSERATAVWLTAPGETLISRIREGSRYSQRPPDEQAFIQKFAERTLAFGRGIERFTQERKLPAVRVVAGDTEGLVVKKCLRIVRKDLGEHLQENTQA